MDLGSPRSFWKTRWIQIHSSSCDNAHQLLSKCGALVRRWHPRRTRQPSSLRIGEMDGYGLVQGANGKTTTRGVDLLNNNNWCNEAMGMQVAQAKVTEVTRIANKWHFFFPQFRFSSSILVFVPTSSFLSYFNVLRGPYLVPFSAFCLWFFLSPIVSFSGHSFYCPSVFWGLVFMYDFPR